MVSSPFVPHSTTRARARARSLYSSLMLKHPRDMEVEDIAWALGIAVREVEIHGCDGRLMRQGGKGVISINSSMLEAGKKRLTIMHEIGHFDLHDDQSQLEICTDASSLSVYRGSPAEKEANAFAVEFLLPEALIKPRCHNLRPNFDSIGKLAEEFNVSEGRLHVVLPFALNLPPNTGERTLKVSVSWQACSETECLMPELKVIDIPIQEAPPG